MWVCWFWRLLWNLHFLLSWLWRLRNAVHHRVLYWGLLYWYWRYLWLHRLRLLCLPSILKVEVHLLTSSWWFSCYLVRLHPWSCPKQWVHISILIDLRWRRGLLSYRLWLFFESVIAKHVEHSAIFLGIRCLWWLDFFCPIVHCILLGKVTADAIISFIVRFFLENRVCFCSINSLLFLKLFFFELFRGFHAKLFVILRLSLDIFNQFRYLRVHSDFLFGLFKYLYCFHVLRTFISDLCRLNLSNQLPHWAITLVCLCLKWTERLRIQVVLNTWKSRSWKFVSVLSLLSSWRQAWNMSQFFFSTRKSKGLWSFRTPIFSFILV